MLPNVCTVLSLKLLVLDYLICLDRLLFQVLLVLNVIILLEMECVGKDLLLVCHHNVLKHFIECFTLRGLRSQLISVFIVFLEHYSVVHTVLFHFDLLVSISNCAQGHWEEAKTQEVTVEESDICQEFFPLFLKSLYSMSIELTEENICPLLTLYDKYMVGKHKEVRKNLTDA